jgi:hypothetical protein
MKNLFTCSLLTLTAAGLALLAAGKSGALAANPSPVKESRCFELRTYYAAPGKLDELSARFRDHTLKLFARHGLTSVGYWMPAENPENKLIYLLAFPSREAAKKSWSEFSSDPEWKEVVKKTQANGKLTTKVESIYLAATDFSPAVTPSVSAEPRAFELRTYKAQPDELSALLARFRDHTVKLFAKHGMTQFGYFTPLDKEKGADDTLIYILVHKSKEAADASFAAFRADPAWVSAKAASEKDGPLTLPAPDGVKSVFMLPTDYSPSR